MYVCCFAKKRDQKPNLVIKIRGTKFVVVTLLRVTEVIGPQIIVDTNFILTCFQDLLSFSRGGLGVEYLLHKKCHSAPVDRIPSSMVN